MIVDRFCGERHFQVARSGRSEQGGISFLHMVATAINFGPKTKRRFKGFNHVKSREFDKASLLDY
jgi:hypothetical protein